MIRSREMADRPTLRGVFDGLVLAFKPRGSSSLASRGASVGFRLRLVAGGLLAAGDWRDQVSGTRKG